MRISDWSSDVCSSDLIDVMLVLLIIFMVTAPLMNPGVDVDLPDSNAKSLKQSKDPMIVQVAADGAYALVQPGDDRPRPVSEEELRARIRAILHQNPNQAIFVGGDAATSYQTLMDALALLQLAGGGKIGLMDDTNPQRRH